MTHHTSLSISFVQPPCRTKRIKKGQMIWLVEIRNQKTKTNGLLSLKKLIGGLYAKTRSLDRNKHRPDLAEICPVLCPTHDLSLKLMGRGWRWTSVCSFDS